MRRYLAATALVVAAAVAVLIITGGSSPSAGAASSSAKSSGSTTVARRDLIETDTESGTLSFADARTAYNRRSGTITSLSAAGTVARPGGVLFTVDNAPIVLMDGTTPAYRTLSAGVGDGPDVQELERNLVTLGFDTGHAITVDEHFDAATTAAVERWQASLGQTQTGTVTLGQIVFLPGARRVSAVSASVGSTGGGSAAGGSGASTASLRLGAPRAEFVDLTTSTSTATRTTLPPSTTATTTSSSPGPRTRGPAMSPSIAALIAVLRAEVAELKATRTTAAAGSSPGRSAGVTGTASRGASSAGGSASSASGSSAGGSGTGSGTAAQAVLTTTSTQLVATVPLDATKQSEAVLGAPVTVQMPDGSTVDGRISKIAAAAQNSSSSSGSGSGASAGSGGGSGASASSTVPVTISLRGHRRSAGLDQAAVSVNFEQQKARHVLSVPVTALLATAGGGYAVQEVAAPHRLIPVTPGLFAAGYVQITGAGIFEGLAVTDSQG